MAARGTVVTEPIDPVGLELLRAETKLVVAAEPTLEALLRLAPEADALIVRTAPCNRQVIEASPRLKVIGKHGVGVDNIDVAAATKQGIPVFFTPGANAEAVAEMALAMMLGLARRLRPAQRFVEEGRFLEGRLTYRGVEMQGKTLGVIGLGRIGSLLAQKCSAAFSMRVLVYDPYIASPPEIPGVQLERVSELDDLLERADFISVHVPLTPATRSLIGPAQLARMKPTAYLVNTSRGAVVDEAALAAALRSGAIAGAGIDVFATEPTPPDHPLYGLDDVLLSPHVGGQTNEAMQAMARACAEGVLAALAGGRPSAVLNPAVYEAGRA